MDTTALFISAALAFFAGAQQAEPEAATPVAPSPAPVAETPAEPDAAPSGAAEVETLDAPEPLSVDEGALRAQVWLTALDTLSARFVQLAANGEESAGMLHLDRPGRARFDYDDPNPVLVVADGTTVAIADFALETVDRAPIRATPLRFLLNADLDLTGTGAIADASRNQGRLFVTLIDPNGEVDGRLTLVFDDPDPSAPAEAMGLLGWYAVDALGGLTEVQLSDAELGAALDPRLFILDDEDVMGGDRRRTRRR